MRIIICIFQVLSAGHVNAEPVMNPLRDEPDSMDKLVEKVVAKLIDRAIDFKHIFDGIKKLEDPKPKVGRRRWLGDKTMGPPFGIVSGDESKNQPNLPPEVHLKEFYIGHGLQYRRDNMTRYRRQKEELRLKGFCGPWGREQTYEWTRTRLEARVQALSMQDPEPLELIPYKYVQEPMTDPMVPKAGLPGYVPKPLIDLNVHKPQTLNELKAQGNVEVGKVKWDPADHEQYAPTEDLDKATLGKTCPVAKD